MFCISQGFKSLDTYRIIADIPSRDNMKITGASSLASCAFCGSAKPLSLVISNFVKNEDLTFNG